MNLTYHWFNKDKTSIVQKGSGIDIIFPDGEAKFNELASQGIGVAVFKEPRLTATQVDLNRQGAYIAESDPLFFQWQAGEGTKEAWIAKREEIKARNPYEEESN